MSPPLQAYAWMRRTLAIRADDHAEEAARPDNMPMLLIGILWSRFTRRAIALTPRLSGSVISRGLPNGSEVRGCFSCRIPSAEWSRQGQMLGLPVL